MLLLNLPILNECEVKKAVQAGKILQSRYENYLNFLAEFKTKKRW